MSVSDLLEYLAPGDLLAGTYRYRVYERWWPVSRSDRFTLPLPRPQAEISAEAA